MNFPPQLTHATAAALIAEFFQRSEGQWRSERRYYTLPQGETQEMVSILTVRFLPQGSPELIHLAQLHGLTNATGMACGAEVTWNSEETKSARKQSQGQTLFGAEGTILYRDRGFATTKPITADFHCPNSQILCLRTEYNGSVFEEELKLVGQNYRTRQSIISRAGEQIMIGQYLEKRL